MRYLLCAIGMSGRILIGICHEEKELIRAFGDRYSRYMR